MRIDVISVVPALLDSFLNHSILQRAQDKKLLEVEVHDLREFGQGNYRQVDDYQYGGGAGMVLMVEPLASCIEGLQSVRDYDEVIYMTPDAPTLDQTTANGLSLKKNLMIICGHYKGIDQRIRDLFVTKEISVGDYVLSGGEIPAALLIDCLGRLIPGVLNNETSALFDSHQDGMLAPPVYTRPADFRGHQVPEVLLSGHEAKIEAWRQEQAERRTKEIRPDMDI